MNSKKNWILQVDPSVFKYIKKIPRDDAERVLFIIQNLPADPFYGDIQKMKGEQNTWRKRIGVYRIFYEVLNSEKIIHVFNIERRSSNTY